MSPLNARALFRVGALVGLGFLLVACETRPEIRTQAAANANLAHYRTYGFMPKPGTDKDGYKTLTTQTLERSVGREMLSRGYTPAGGGQPDLLINFSVKTRDKVEGDSGPAFGLGYGYGWGRGHYGYGFGFNDYYNDIQTVTEGSLMVDLVDREHNEVVWSGTAVGRLTKKVLDDPDPQIERSVAEIFARYPIKAAGQPH
ncbi:MAG: putative lipoprotein [Gammaproteobacteria bacterium]|jgi:hypothetical protein|nr:putative lipoprotein [Gammaproteobacteria bacterium]